MFDDFKDWLYNFIKSRNFVLIAVFFLFWLDIKYLGSDLIVDSVSLLVYTMIAADAYYCYRLSGKKIWIVLAIIFAAAMIPSVYSYVLYKKGKDILYARY